MEWTFTSIIIQYFYSILWNFIVNYNTTLLFILFKTKSGLQSLIISCRIKVTTIHSLIGFKTLTLDAQKMKYSEKREADCGFDQSKYRSMACVWIQPIRWQRSLIMRGEKWYKQLAPPGTDWAYFLVLVTLLLRLKISLNFHKSFAVSLV